MASPMVMDESNTLDEPVYLTLWRDIYAIIVKTFHVIVPCIPHSKGAIVLRDWDLWGPLLYCFTLAILLGVRAPKNEGVSQTNMSEQGTIMFSAVFVIVWMGAGVVTINAKLLGGKISFFQSLSVFGYCLFPIAGSSVATLFWKNVYFRLGVCLAGVIWSCVASIGFMASLVPQKRKVLAVYPVLLFYTVLGWMVLIQP